MEVSWSLVMILHCKDWIVSYEWFIPGLIFAFVLFLSDRRWNESRAWKAPLSSKG